MNQKPSPKKGFERVWAAFFYSLDGLRYAFSNEAAFRQELFVVSISSIALFLLPFSFLCKCLLWFATINILVVEILNSALEAVVDLASPNSISLPSTRKI
jgi:diacylglycerol kinase (ATP)